MTTEKEKMLAGELYRATDPELAAEHMRAQDLLHRFNATRPEDLEKRLALLKELFGQLGEGSGDPGLTVITKRLTG